MSSFCTAKATHFFSKKFPHICVSLDVNFNESLTNDIVSFEQLGPGFLKKVSTLLRSQFSPLKQHLRRKTKTVSTEFSSVKVCTFLSKDLLNHSLHLHVESV